MDGLTSSSPDLKQRDHLRGETLAGSQNRYSENDSYLFMPNATASFQLKCVSHNKEHGFVSIELGWKGERFNPQTQTQLEILQLCYYPQNRICPLLNKFLLHLQQCGINPCA